MFALTPPSTSSANWSESILWSLGNGSDGIQPYAGLIRDSGGNLYGTTSAGGTGSPSGAGTVFEISPGGPETPTPTPAPTPASTVLTASPTQLNFGNVIAPGTGKPKKVTLTNKGKAVAQIWNRTVTAPFTIGPGLNTCVGATIAPKNNCSFYVEFAPTKVGPVSGGSIHVYYNGANPAVALKGNGIAKGK